jgi:HSP20 family protein
MKDKPSLNPLEDIRNYREALRQMVESGWILPRDLMPSAMNEILLPIDLLDYGPELVIKVSLPGVKPEDVSLTVLENTLTIKATSREDEDNRGAIYLRRERRINQFTRSIKLPTPVEAERAEAVFKHGVLTLTLPKSKHSRGRVITLKDQ